MTILDGSIVTVAMPAIQRDLGFSASSLAWVIDAYLVAFAGLLLLSGRIGDLVGRKRMLVAGLSTFTAASLLCGLAVTPAMLIAARFVQGIGGAMISAVSLGMLVTLFPEPSDRAKAIGAFSFVGAAGASIGQVVGGILTQAVGWHWIFLINLPIGLLAIVLAIRVLATDPGVGSGADGLGAILVTAGLMTGVYAIVETAHYGWTSSPTLGLGALSLVLLALFVARQARTAHPLLPLDILRSRNVTGANVVQALVIAALFAFQVLIALYMQNVLGYGAAKTGLAMLPAAVAIGMVSLVLAAHLISRFGERPVLLVGLALLVLGLLLLTRAPVDATYLVHIFPTMLLAGGFGLAMPALTSLGMSGATTRDAGATSGLFNTTQQVGAALGVAALAALAAARSHRLIANGEASVSALTSGYHLAFGIGAGLVAVAAIVAATVLRPSTPAHQEDRIPDAVFLVQ